MKHVREDVPDVQRLRPELSAATAAVVERAVSQGPRAPLPRRGEHGRRPRGGARGRGLARRPGDRRGDERAAHAARARPGGGCRGACATRRAGSLSLALLVAIVAIALVIAAGRAHRGAGRAAGHRLARRPRTGAARPDGRPRLQPVRHRPRKPRPDRQRRRRRPQHRRGAPSSTTTARSRSPAASASGVYLDAAPRVLAKALEIQTPTPGLRRADLRRPTTSSSNCPTATRRR